LNSSGFLEILLLNAFARPCGQEKKAVAYLPLKGDGR
jgi:hypothetical protein